MSYIPTESNSSDVCDIFNEWITSPRREQIETVGNLAREASPKFFFDRLDFTTRLLDAAWRHGMKTYRRVAGFLYDSTLFGMRVGTPGKPVSQDIELPDRARAVAGRLPSGSPAYRFFRNLAKFAEQRIREEVEGEQLPVDKIFARLVRDNDGVDGRDVLGQAGQRPQRLPAHPWADVIAREQWRRAHQARALISHHKRRHDPIPVNLRI